MQPAEHLAFQRRQQLVAPVEHAAQGVVARQRAAHVLEHAQPLSQLAMHLVQAQRGHARCRHLDGQRQAVELAAQVDGGGQRGLVQGKGRIEGDDAAHQQGHRARVGRLGRGRADLRYFQGRQPVHGLLGDVQGRLGRGEPAHGGSGRARLRHELRDLRQHLLAVVERDHRFQRPERPQQLAARLGVAARVDPQHLAQGREELGLVAHRREIHPVDRTGVLRRHQGDDRARQAGLADAAGAHDRDERPLATPFAQRRQFLRASHQLVLDRQRHARQLGSGRGHPHVRVDRRIAQDVADARHRGDRARAQHLAQGSDLDRDVVLLDHEPRPGGVQKLALGHHLAGADGQHAQQVESAAAHRRGASVDQQQAFRRADFPPLKADRIDRDTQRRHVSVKGIGGEATAGGPGTQACIGSCARGMLKPDDKCGTRVRQAA